MINRIIIASMLVLALVSFDATGARAKNPVTDVVALAGTEFRFDGSPGQRTYLGVGSATQLALGEIKADYVIVALFNAFCTICQEDAPVLNGLYRLVEDNAALKGRAKMVGIALGNTDAEVEMFRGKYDLQFPTCADPAYSMERAIPENLRAPMLLTLKRVDGQSFEVIKWHFGRIENVENVVAETVGAATLDSAKVMARGERVSR